MTLALTSNPVDWALAVVFGIPLLIVAVSWLVVYAQESPKRCPCRWCQQRRRYQYERRLPVRAWRKIDTFIGGER